MTLNNLLFYLSNLSAPYGQIPSTMDLLSPSDQKILTTDLLSPFGKKIDPILVTCFGGLTSPKLTPFRVSNLSAPYGQIPSTTDLLSPSDQKISATDLLSPFDKKIDPILVTF